jgi:hypothetical protein
MYNRANRSLSHFIEFSPAVVILLGPARPLGPAQL